jgi:hypothetical protein
MAQGYLPDSMLDNFQAPPQPIPSGFSDEVYASAMREERMAGIIAHINPDVLVEDIEYRLRGYRKDTGSGQWIKISRTAKEVSPDLIANFISFLTSILNQNTTMSNYQDVDINNIMELVIEFVVDDIDSNAELYGIMDSYSERTRIALIVCQTTFSVLKRARNGTEARRIFKALDLREATMSSGGGGGGPRGKLDFLKFWKN